MRVRPLRPETSSRLCRRAWELGGVVDGGAFDPAAFSGSERVATHSGDVCRWLADRLPSDRTAILVCWGPDLGVLTDWALFIKRWDTFCYPSSDDVMILPLDSSWALRYDHEEEFVFAMRRPPG